MSSPTALEHKSHIPGSIGCVVITCSDTRTTETDTSGYRIMHLLKDAGHSVIAYHLVKDEPAKIKAKIKAATAGIIKGRVLFSTPGSENAVRLAMEKLILPELGHLVKELTK